MSIHTRWEQGVVAHVKQAAGKTIDFMKSGIHAFADRDGRQEELFRILLEERNTLYTKLHASGKIHLEDFGCITDMLGDGLKHPEMVVRATIDIYTRGLNAAGVLCREDWRRFTQDWLQEHAASCVSS